MGKQLTQKDILNRLEKGDMHKKEFAGQKIGDIDFSKFQFNNVVNFEGAEFVGKIIFRKAKFLKKLYLTEQN